MKTSRKCTLIVLLSLLGLGLAGSATAGKLQQELVQESAVEQIMQRGILKVGMSTFVPWAMKDKTGKLIGFEIDVATRLATDMGVKVEFIPTKWAGIIPALLTGKFDVIIGGMSVRPDAANKLMPRATKRFFDDEAQVIQEVVNGQAHAAVASAPLPAFQAIKNPDRLFLPFQGTFTREPIGFALRKGDYDTLNYFNNWIRVVEAQGWLAERKHYWFETKDWEGMLK
jgi:polar amino acid transport system substrate-binding protein